MIPMYVFSDLYCRDLGHDIVSEDTTDDDPAFVYWTVPQPNGTDNDVPDPSLYGDSLATTAQNNGIYIYYYNLKLRIKTLGISVWQNLLENTFA